MNVSKLLSALALSGLMISTSAMADNNQGSGTVKFTGSINTGACSIAPESVDQTVNLGSVTKSTLVNTGSSKPQYFEIHLEDCDLEGLADNTISITFNGASAGTGADANLLGIVGEAQGAGIQITDSNGQPVEIGKKGAARHVIKEGSNTLLFSAYLKSLTANGADSDAIIPGEYSSVADFVLSYE